MSTADDADSTRLGRTWTLILAVLTAAACIMVVILTMRVRELTNEVRNLRFERNLPQVGDVVPALRAAQLGGDSVDLARPGVGHRQVWFVFNTTCPICEASLGAWSAAFGQAMGDPSLSFLGLSLDSARSTLTYVQHHRLPFPVVILEDPRAAATYRVRGVPLTMVIDEGGRVRLVRPGRFTDQARDSLLTFLSRRQ